MWTDGSDTEEYLGTEDIVQVPYLYSTRHAVLFSQSSSLLGSIMREVLAPLVYWYIVN